MRLINLIPLKEMENPCWKGYEMVGTKKKDGREVPNCVTVKENVVSETTGREAKEIARLTGTRDSIVQKFIDDFNLNAKNLFNFIAKGKEKVRKDFATAMSGRPGNKYQGDFVGMFGEDINSDDDVNYGLVEPEEYEIKSSMSSSSTSYSSGSTKP